MTKEESELFTRTDRGTPCGELMRRYWQPAALSEELPQGGAPLPVQLLGEDLVLFRDNEGRPGLLGLHCSHRGADLSYGRVEDGGLRCIYHGWLYDIHGRCLDQPGEPGGGEHRDAIRHPAYPCEEHAGVIFAYLGPGDPPLFPNYEFLSALENHVFVTKRFHECNYMQANEGNIDLSHLSFLHYNSLNRGVGAGIGAAITERDTGGVAALADEILCPRGAAPEVDMADAELTAFGVRSFKIRRDMGPDRYHLYITDFVVPNFTAFPGGSRGKGGYMVNWHAPIDDTHHWKYTFMFTRQGAFDKERLRVSHSRRMTDYRSFQNRGNRYLQERMSMRIKSYIGIGYDHEIQDGGLQDQFVTEGQGPIQNREEEHLVSMDRAIVAARKVLLNAITALQEGREVINVTRDSSANRFRIVAFKGVLPGSTNWRDYGKELEAEIPV